MPYTYLYFRNNEYDDEDCDDDDDVGGLGRKWGGEVSSQQPSTIDFLCSIPFDEYGIKRAINSHRGHSCTIQHHTLLNAK